MKKVLMTLVLLSLAVPAMAEQKKWLDWKCLKAEVGVNRDIINVDKERPEAENWGGVASLKYDLKFPKKYDTACQLEFRLRRAFNSDAKLDGQLGVLFRLY